MEQKKSFINQSYDKFAEKTTTKSKPEEVDLGSVGSYKFKIGIRHIKSPNIESLLLDVRLNCKDWLFIRNGKMYIKADVHRFELEANENYSKVLGHQKIGNTSVDLGLEESAYYNIDKDILEKICEAGNLEIRISGESYCDFDGKKLENFKLLCKQFYNNFYDAGRFTEVLSQKVKSGGCFVATAAMGNYNHPIVIDLREFRDTWLLRRTWGIQFTEWYYLKGPHLASFIEKSKILRFCAFILVVKPLHILTRKIKKSK